MAAIEPVYISYLNYIGSGAPADGDQITRDNSTYPLNCVYTDRETGIRYVRKATTKIAATDWAADGSGSSVTYETPATVDFITSNNTFILNTGLGGTTYQKSTQPDATVLGREFLLSDTEYKFILKNPDRNIAITDATVLTIDSVEQTGTLAEKAEILKGVFFLTSTSNLQDVFDAGSTLDKNNKVKIPLTKILDIIAGDDTGANKYTDVYVYEDYVYMYAQDDGNNNNGLVEVKMDAIRMNHNGALGYAQIKLKDGKATLTTSGDFTERDIASVRVEDDYANDAAAATGGIVVGQVYHTSGTLKIRLV